MFALKLSKKNFLILVIYSSTQELLAAKCDVEVKFFVSHIEKKELTFLVAMRCLVAKNICPNNVTS